MVSNVFNIIEKRNQDGIYFEKKIIRSSSLDLIHIRTATVQTESFTYYYLYNSRLEPITDVFRFINFELEGSSTNSIAVALHALKFLYTFLEIFGLQLDTLTKTDARNFISFLKGSTRQGALYSFQFFTHRSNACINNYLAVYRHYLIYLGIKESVLLLKQSRNLSFHMNELSNETNVTRYQISARAYLNNISVPQYISIDDFKKIIDVIRKDYTSREECIVRLMFESGLRIGEVLGLTSDDIEIIETPEGQVGYLYIRNRRSDTRDRLAKTCLNVTNPQQYFSKEYSTKDVGFQVAFANINLINKINDYVNEFHAIYTPKFKSNFARYSIADRTRKEQVGEINNYYLIINSIGRPLSANLWNKTLRIIFRKAGLQVDERVKKNNLSHRFRHGFAMFMVQHKHINDFELRILMRHRSIQSVLIYYRPTEEDVAKLKADYVSSIYELIPELSI